MNQAGIVARLTLNAIRYRFLKYTGRPGRLQAISLEITHRCICKCRMCNIWRIPQEQADLPLSFWTGLLSSPELGSLREIDITGGEPFLRQDLPELLTTIGQAKPQSFTELKTLAITTNGILTSRVLKVVADVAGLLQTQGIDLVLACGLDAVGSLHDRIRGLQGAWDKLAATIAGLKTLRDKHPNLVLGLKTTIIPENVGELDKIAAFAQTQGLFTIISPCIITANRFGNLDLQEDLQFSQADLEQMAEFYAEREETWCQHRQTMLGYLQTGVVNKPCSAGFNTLFIRHTGEVFPCPIIPHRLGQIGQQSLEALLSSPPARSFRQQIGNFPECRNCTEPGLERIAWPYEGINCLNRLRILGFTEFNRLFQQMGLDKYL